MWKEFEIDFDIDFTNELIKNGIYQEYKRGIIKAKPDKSRFVKVYNFVPIIRVFDDNSNVLFTIKKTNVEKPKIVSENFSLENRAYFSNVYTTDNYIYVLNQNCKIEDVIYNNCNSVEIYCFDWSGNPIKNFQLNESIGMLSPFAVDEENKNIYIVSPKDSISNILKFAY
jgi:hypothetical protein